LPARRQNLTAHRQDSSKHHGTFFGGCTVIINGAGGITGEGERVETATSVLFVSGAINNNGAGRRYYRKGKGKNRDFGTVRERGNQ
jgi:hypothetical protein